MTDQKSRKYLLTISNPLDYGFDHVQITDTLATLPIDYWCLADEQATTGTMHTHIFLYAENTIRFNTLKRKFPVAHIDKAHGSCTENRDYVMKGGKWAKTAKAMTSIPGSFEEWGTIPTEGQEDAAKTAKLLEDIKSGKSTAEILQEKPSFLFRVNEIDRVRQTFLAEEYMKKNRALDVTYLYGASGSGKTRSIYDRHSAVDVCRITHYGKNGIPNFDAYCGQPVLVFEEFHSQIDLPNMLNFLDVYPLMLPARYADKVACYTTVYITSNLSLEEQYSFEKIHRPESWRAFYRRIHHIQEFLPDGTIIVRK